MSWALADHEPKKRLVVENNNSSGKCLRKRLIDWLDCFVHATALNGLQINEGDKVSYEEQESEKGMTAVDVALL
ncbi:cold shock domain-containing protein [bacterium]|nr:cold shock domain-containing protein [bacterium]